MAHLRAYVGLGANVGDARQTLRDAVRSLSELRDVADAKLAAVSRLYVTRPVDVLEQPPFHNGVVGLDLEVGDTSVRDAVRLLVALKDLERAYGRQDRFHHGPRELDLDLLIFGDHVISMERPPEGESIDPAKAGKLLVVPHPEASRRLFVLAPLSDIDPGLRPPGWTETVAQARQRQETIEGPDAVRAVGAWDGAAWDWREGPR